MALRRYVADEVEHAVAYYGDGTPFFDFIDQAVTKVEVFDYLRDRILDDVSFKTDGILTSGKFGWAFSMYAAYRPVLPKVLNFPGNLRHEDLYDSGADPGIKDREFVFIDNSIYKARTLRKIEAYIERWGGRINRAYVIYDGSRPDHSWTRRGYPYDYVYRWHEGGFKP